MAKNWKTSEAVAAIKSGSTEDKMDIGKRFPLFSILAAQLNDAGVEFAKAVPDYVSARKIESVLKGDAQESPEDEEVESDAEPEVKEDKKPAKEVKEDKKKAGKGKDKKKESEEPADEDWDDEEEEVEADPYEGKSAKELYAMCMKKKLKVAPKKKAEEYIKALKAADKKKGTKDTKKEDKPADDDEDWDI